MLNSQAIITYQCWYCLTPLWEHWCWSSNLDIEIFTQPQCHNNRNITMRPFQCKRKQSQGRTCSSSKKFSSLKIPKCKYAAGDWKAKCDTLEKCDTHPTQSGPIAIFKILQNEIYPKLTFKYLKVGMETNGKSLFISFYIGLHNDIDSNLLISAVNTSKCHIIIYSSTIMIIYSSRISIKVIIVVFIMFLSSSYALPHSTHDLTNAQITVWASRKSYFKHCANLDGNLQMQTQHLNDLIIIIWQALWALHILNFISKSSPPG